MANRSTIVVPDAWQYQAETFLAYWSPSTIATEGLASHCIDDSIVFLTIKLFEQDARQAEVWRPCHIINAF